MSNKQYAIHKERVVALLRQLDVLKGQDQAKVMVTATMLAAGNGYLLAPPGLGKTTLVKIYQKAISGSVSRRIQMTPDVHPRDLVGYKDFDQVNKEYFFVPGPLVGANVVLVDEISRALGLTHAALLEAMQEGQITHVDRVGAIKLPKVFCVLATGNPLEQEGVNPLPEALKDRFLVQIDMPYGSREDDLSMLSDLNALNDPTAKVSAVMSIEDMEEAQKAVLHIANTASVQAKGYVVDLNRASRPNTEYFKEVHGAGANDLSQYVAVGASPRGEIATLMIAAALVLIHGDDYIEPTHVKEAFQYTLPVRVIMRPESQIDGFTTKDLVEKTLARVRIIGKS